MAALIKSIPTEECRSCVQATESKSQDEHDVPCWSNNLLYDPLGDKFKNLTDKSFQTTHLC